MSAWQDTRPSRVAGMSARDEILARLRSALEVPRRDEVTEAGDVPRAYQQADDRGESSDPAKIRQLLVKRLEDYTATVHRTTASGLPGAVAAALEGAATVIAPPGVPDSWLASSDIAVTRDDGTAGPRELDRIDAVLTGCHTAIATTGTILLRSDELSGRRAISLLPDLHVIVVQSDQIVLGVPRGIERMGEDPKAPWTMISGPSATSDIELSRVEGVHGPRRLHIVIVEPEPEPEPEPTSEQASEQAATAASGTGPKTERATRPAPARAARPAPAAPKTAQTSEETS